MSRLYRALAVAMIMIGMLVIAVSIQRAFRAWGAQMPLHCTSDGCRAILRDGTLSTTTYPQPSGVSR